MKRLVQWMVALATFAVLATSAQAQFFLQFSPSSLNFGGLNVGETKELFAYMVYYGNDPVVPDYGWSQNSTSQFTSQFTIINTHPDSTALRQGDTVRFVVIYHPTLAGQYTVTYQARLLGMAANLTISGYATAASDLTIQVNDCSNNETKVGETSDTCTIWMTNQSDQDMRIVMEDLDPRFTISADGGITNVDFITLASKETIRLSYRFTPDAVGVVTNVVKLVNGSDVYYMTLIGRGVDGPAPSLIEIDPRSVYFTVNDVTETTEQEVSVTNTGTTAFYLTTFNITGPESANFEVFDYTPLPLVLNPGESTLARIRFTPSGTGDAFVAQLTFEGTTNGVFGTGIATADLYGSIAARPTDTLRVAIANTGGPIGGTANVVFTNMSQVPSNISYGRATLRYNASVLVPQETLLDDAIVDGMRTSTFRIEPASRQEGEMLDMLKFTITLGDAEQTPVDLVKMDWFDADETRLGTQTVANGAVVSVEDAEGRTVNANGDVMTLSLSPIPALDNVTITYLAIPGTASLKVFGTNGVLVMDLTDRLQGAPEQGAIQVDMSSLLNGTYYMRLSVGQSTVVRRFIVN